MTKSKFGPFKSTGALPCGESRHWDPWSGSSRRPDHGLPIGGNRLQHTRLASRSSSEWSVDNAAISLLIIASVARDSPNRPRACRLDLNLEILVVDRGDHGGAAFRQGDGSQKRRLACLILGSGSSRRSETAAGHASLA